jgi:hypothetical protein
LLLLMKGHLWESILMYPPLIPMILLFSFLIIHLIFKFHKGGIYIMYIFIVVVSLVVTNYLVKLFY